MPWLVILPCTAGRRNVEAGLSRGLNGSGGPIWIRATLRITGDRLHVDIETTASRIPRAVHVWRQRCHLVRKPAARQMTDTTS